MSERPDFLAHLARESALFATVLRALAPGAQVPTCPDWTAADLWWHLADVQWFWGMVLATGALTTAQVEAFERVRRDEVDVPAFYDEVGARLQAELAAAPDRREAWTWADDQTVGFIRRRQAHEALIHRLDAELTAGTRSPLPPLLAEDGIDEVLRIMKSASAPWAEVTHTGGELRARTTDTGRTWVVTPARFVGIDPDDGTGYDEPTVVVAANDDGRNAEAEVSGTAADLDCWLWNRPPEGEVQRVGAPDVLGLFEEVRLEALD